MQATQTFSPVFTLRADGTYQLVIPASTDAVKVTAWLESKGAVADRYFRSDSTKFVFSVIPASLVDAITSKYSLVDETPAIAPEFRVNGFTKEEFEQRNFGDVLSALTPREIKKALVRMNCWKHVQQEMREFGGTPVERLRYILGGIHLSDFDVLELVGRTNIPEPVVQYTADYEIGAGSNDSFHVNCDNMGKAIASKYSLVDETPATTVTPETTQETPDYVFIKRGDLPDSECIYNVYWFECKSPAIAEELADNLEHSLNTCWFINVQGSRVVFEDPEMEDSMIPYILNQLIARFGKPVNQEDLRQASTPLPWDAPTTETYFFDDCYTPEELKAKYRQLSKIHHPDAGGNPDTFVELTKQYEFQLAIAFEESQDY
jgi:hypothetical protein